MLVVKLNDKIVAYPSTEQSAKEIQAAHPGSKIEQITATAARADFDRCFANWID